MIYIFKTSVDTKLKFEEATVMLNRLLPNTIWNFDLEDCDNILRIDCKTEFLESILNNGIFDCIELEG
ncbi:hypothetical protein AB3G33_04270 [Flavobacterium sp. WC2421]|jgi:hypothetical protein|uniref:Uncharacterized protein n=3 Tax=unclassified Flavobacterium TaxID=196869 RepID=A0AB39WDM7_9FLAO